MCKKTRPTAYKNHQHTTENPPVSTPFNGAYDEYYDGSLHKELVNLVLQAVALVALPNSNHLAVTF